MEYVAIDFESASRLSNSACAVGLARFDEEGTLLASYYSLICPPSLIFEDVCTSVHQLDPLEISKAPKLVELWPEIKAFIGKGPLVAHNAQFDMNILSSTLQHYGLEIPPYKYYCTYSLARKLWPDKASYKLSSLTSDFLWEYKAHYALDDAVMCGRLFSKLCGSNLFDEALLARFLKKIYKKSKSGFPRILTPPEQA